MARGVSVQLFISHSGKDREWVELVCKRIEAAGFTAYLAEYDIAGIGQDLHLAGYPGIDHHRGAC